VRALLRESGAAFLGLHWGFTVSRIRLRHAAALACGLFALPAFADELLFSSPGDLYAITKDSIVVTGAAPVDQEIADDFHATGEIHRAVVDGYDCWNCGRPFSEHPIEQRDTIPPGKAHAIDPEWWKSEA
jgi:hypothetical protein